MLIKEYKEEELKRLKDAELSILKDFDDICKKNKIDYFLDGGSLLGAIRHKGFIPWDDDLDVGMTRENYEKFLNIYEKELSDKYILATPKLHKGYAGAVIKLMRRGTKFVPTFSTEMKCELGIYIDIFIWDNLSDDRIKAWLQVKLARILSRLIFLSGSSKPDIPYKGIVKFLMKKGCQLIHWILQIIPNSNEKLYTLFEKISTKENGKNTKYITSFQTNKPFKHVYEKANLKPYLITDFEGFSASIQNNYEENLRMCFGDDYMELPPIEKRVNHCAEIVDFGEIY